MHVRTFKHTSGKTFIISGKTNILQNPEMKLLGNFFADKRLGKHACRIRITNTRSVIPFSNSSFFLYLLCCRFHQVNSYGNNLAVSQQWKHEVVFNKTTYSRCTSECDPSFTADTVQFMGYSDLDVMPDQIRWGLLVYCILYCHLYSTIAILFVSPC